MIQGNKFQKLKFDFDGDNVEQAEKDFTLVLTAIKETFKKQFGMLLKSSDMAICSSHGDAKRSWHIIITGYYVANNMQARAFYDRVAVNAPQTKTRKGNPCLDPSVYSNFQNFRMFGSSKKGSDRMKGLDPLSTFFALEDTLITNVEGCVPLQEIVLPQIVTSGPHLKHSQQEVIDILERLRPERWQEYNMWLKIGMALKSELGTDGLALWKQFSERHYADFEEGKHDKKWNSFKKQGTTIGTIIQWAVEDDKLNFLDR